MQQFYETTVTFYIAPSKERDPLVRKLLSERKFTRKGGFLTGSYIVNGGYLEKEPFYGDRQWRKWIILLEDLLSGNYECKCHDETYTEVLNLGYISEDHRTIVQDVDYDGNTTVIYDAWCDKVGDTHYKIGTSTEYEPSQSWVRWEEKKNSRKEKLKLFWLAFPNLMFMMKHERPPTPEELAKESCQPFSEEGMRHREQNSPDALTANLCPCGI